MYRCPACGYYAFKSAILNEGTICVDFGFQTIEVSLPSKDGNEEKRYNNNRCSYWVNYDPPGNSVYFYNKNLAFGNAVGFSGCAPIFRTVGRED
jgi:hypothetical protein